MNAAGNPAPGEKRSRGADDDTGNGPDPEHRNGDDKNRKYMTAREGLSRGVFFYDRRSGAGHLIGARRVDHVPEYCEQHKRYPGHKNSRHEAWLPVCQMVNRKIYEQKRVQGVHRFAIVTAGRRLSGDEFEKALDTYRTLSCENHVGLCASFGLLEEEQFSDLRRAGVTRYHANIETSRANFKNICTTHTFEDKLECIRRAKAAGLEVCSGGIIGMGESWQDRIDMALTLSELGVSSIPINALIPIKGTPLENIERITESDILRTVAIFRFIVPEADIRLAAGRNLMTNCGERAFLSGANSAITGDMLTTSGNRIREDIAMLNRIGYSMERDNNA